jgi:diguanylate cyclase
MGGWVRGLPGPVWTLALWMAVATIDGLILLGQHSWSTGEGDVWSLQTCFTALALVAILVLGRRTPTWILVGVVVIQTTLIGLNIARTTHVEDAFLSTLGIVIAVLYVGLWWSGAITYTYAGAASAVLLAGLLVSDVMESWIQVWLVLTSVVFGMTVGLNMAVGTMNRQARHDQLTGMLNTIGLQEYTDMHRRAGRTMTPRALVVIDLDGFKRINDTQGHLAGNEVLRALGIAWRQALRPDDVAARIGGDEFLLVLPQTDARGATVLLDRLHEASPTPWSSGVTLWESGESFEAAQRRADELMYVDKQQRAGQSRNATA